MNKSPEIDNSRTVSLEALKSQFYTIIPTDLEEEYYIIKCSKVLRNPKSVQKESHDITDQLVRNLQGCTETRSTVLSKRHNVQLIFSSIYLHWS